MKLLQQLMLQQQILMKKKIRIATLKLHEHADMMSMQNTYCMHLQNKPWAASYVALFFFLGISLLVLHSMQYNE